MMDLPLALPALALQKRFWDRFFWFREDNHPYPELTNHHEPVDSRHRDTLGDTLPGCRLVYPVGRRRGLRLDFDIELQYFQLDLLRPSRRPTQIAWDDQAHWHPHVLRWEELDLICRCIALADSTVTHPGLPLLLLSRFAPITTAEGPAAVALLRSAWRSVGIDKERQLARLCRRLDARGSDFEWRHHSAMGWCLHQEDGPNQNWGLYTLRCPENTSFPFGDYAAMVTRAQQTGAEAIRPEWRTPAVQALAAAVAAGALDGLPALADALEEAGCDQPAVLAHLRASDDAVRGAWVTELLLECEWGSVLRKCPGAR